MVNKKLEDTINVENIYKFSKTDDIINLIKNINKNNEFEVSINKKTGITYTQYINISKYLIKRNKMKNTDEVEQNKNLILEDTLDIGYNYDISNNKNSYRITIKDINRINRILTNIELRKNNIIFSILVNNILNQNEDESKNMFIINKIRNERNIIDMLDYDLRFSLSEENTIPKDKLIELTKLTENERNKIYYRYKHRLSYIEKYKDFDIKIDITEIRLNYVPNKIHNSNKRYDIEIELIAYNKISNVILGYNILLKEIYFIHKMLQKSSKIISISDKNDVLNNMKKILFNNSENQTKDLPIMQAISLENRHVASNLSTQYSVTDKADGDRYFLMIYNNRIFLISYGLDITEIESTNYNIKDYNNTILDGEYIYISNTNKFLYLAFDILISQGRDIREEINLIVRLNELNKVLNKCFNVKNSNKQYEDFGKLDTILDYYKVYIKNMFNEMNNKLEENDIVIMGKTFIIPKGLYACEIFAYSYLIWQLYTTNEHIKCPYKLDGLIYTPLLQKYTRIFKDVRYPIYKWKPESHNSIDFYIKFEKNQDTMQIINVYDNSIGNELDGNIDDKELINNEGNLEDISDYKIGNKIYRICNLYVGSTKTGIEQPVLFDKENNLYLAYLYLNDGEIRDIEGNIIQDETVVEFAYNNNPLIEHPYRWVPLRTRFDKTEFVHKYKRKYGNYETIAYDIWKTMILPFNFKDISILANENTYESYMRDVIKARITKKDIIKERSQKAYYQIQTNLMKPMRNFHNFIKSNISYIYCGKKFMMNGNYNKLDHLEIGVGRGGELLKLYHARVNSIVAFDIDYEGIYSATDGA
jgi:hypothetical protein